ARIVEQARQCAGLVGRVLVREVAPHDGRTWSQPLSEWTILPGGTPKSVSDGSGPQVVALDFGMKWNIPRHLVDMGCQVTIVPGSYSAEQILELAPDGIFLSNGPGDPEPLEYAIGTIRNLLGKKPVFGICLGHQLLSLACGGETFKM